MISKYVKDKTKPKLDFTAYYGIQSRSPFGPTPCLIPETNAAFKYLPSPKTHKNVLDVGCGQGGWCDRLNNAGYVPTGIDLDVSQYGPAILGDMHEMPFNDNTFDIVFCTGTFEHAFAPFIVLMEFVRVCRDEGTIIITLPMEDNAQMLEDEAHYSVFSKFQLEHMFFKKLKLTLYGYESGLYDPVVGPHQIFAVRVSK